MSKQMKFKVKKTRTFFRGTQYYYQLVGANGEIMMTSEGVKNLGDALSSVHAIRENAGNATIEIDESEAY